MPTDLADSALLPGRVGPADRDDPAVRRCPDLAGAATARKVSRLDVAVPAPVQAGGTQTVTVLPDVDTAVRYAACLREEVTDESLLVDYPVGAQSGASAFADGFDVFRFGTFRRGTAVSTTDLTVGFVEGGPEVDVQALFVALGLQAFERLEPYER